MNLADIRRDYSHAVLDESHVDSDPIEQFRRWLAQAIEVASLEPTAATLATASRDGALWYDDIARLASGRVTPALLEPRATTRARRTELAYYTAVLEPVGADAAALLTRADADYRAKGERRERHQKRSHERAAALAAAGLDAAALERARAAGRCLSDREAGALGLAPSTTGPWRRPD